MGVNVMKFKLISSPFAETTADAAVVGVFLDERIDEILATVDVEFASAKAELVQHISDAAKEDKFTGKLGQILALPTYGQIAAKRLVFVGLGKASEMKAQDARKYAANLSRRFKSAEKVAFFLRNSNVPVTESDASSKKKGNKHTAPVDESNGADLPESNSADSSCYAQAIAEGWKLGGYTFNKYKSGKDETSAKEATLKFAGLDISEKAFAASCQRGDAIAEATNHARRLIAEPACYMTPSKLAEEAKSVAKKTDLTCKVLDVEQIEKLGMGSFLGVARGAKEPCKFIVMKYDAPKSKRTIAIVGKGITFDSGGLSLKPPVGMEHMKYDMTGAAVVIGTMQVIAELQPQVSVLALIAATENMPGHDALHPGDVLKSMNGKTIEVNNTDAEGRLVLADAITYAVGEEVDEIIDIATLTGAVVTALGRVAGGIMGSHQNLVDNLIASGAKAGEKLWQLPLFEEYKDGLKSDIADLKNAGSGGQAGSSSAGMFLQEFTAGKPWAHLDIAGPGWLDRERDECNKGGTAFGVRTLCYYLLDAE
jgi:leucyl aminopeptidase